MTERNIEKLYEKSVELLKTLIEIPSLSKQEEKTADEIGKFLFENGVTPMRKHHNIYAMNQFFDQSKPSILIASHHDTVPPSAGYTRDPYKATIETTKDGESLYGLGSNDAGGCLVTFLAVFLEFYKRKDLSFNLIFAATAEEEISGKNGMASLIADLPQISLGIMGEPTGMDIAVAEKGLIVVDCVSTGKPGHAAREEGINAIYLAMKDIAWVESFKFPKISESLGPVKMSVTVIDAGDKHNVVPDTCKFVLDIRPTDAYSNEEIIEILKNHMDCEVIPRSLRLRPSGVSSDHPIVNLAGKFGAKPYGSATLSDQALLTGFPSFKMAPGESSRSHSADEFVLLSEIRNGIEKYLKIFDSYHAHLEEKSNG